MKKSILVVVMVCMTAVAEVGAEISVPGDYSTIQSAIDAAVDGNTIVVSPGTYHENINFGGKNVILTSTDPENPAVVAGTVIHGVDDDSVGNNVSVVSFSGSETEDCRIMGFTITGGGFLCRRGGGIHGGGSSATISNCTISGNYAVSTGGGLYDCQGSIADCTISNNRTTAGGNGGGLSQCSGTIANCVISDNDAGRDGGGLYMCNGTIANCVISGNHAGYRGGGLYEGDGPIVHCIIANNSSDYSGGGLFDCQGNIANCVISGNYAGDDGGGLSGCSGIISNCTIVDNIGEYDGSGLYHCQGSITNCIIRGNTGTNYEVDNSATPAYCCVAGGGGTNIDADPRFVDADNGDYHLRADSPCINAGDPAHFRGPDELDIDGEPRIMGGRVDMGVDEFTSSLIPYIGLAQREFSFAISYEVNPDDQTLQISTIDGTRLNWQITESCSWLTVSPVSGISTGEVDEVTLSVDTTGLDGCDYDCELTISDPNAANSPRTVVVRLSGGCYGGPDCAEWVTVGRPGSWCGDFQCHGDADNAEGMIGRNVRRVSFGDVDLLILGYNQPYSGSPDLDGGDPDLLPDTWIAADFDHAMGMVGRNARRIDQTDVDILVYYFNNSWGYPQPDCQTLTPTVP